MATEEQIEAGVRGLTVNFGCMRQQDGKPVAWNFGRRLFDVVDPIIMGIVDTG
jgi:hypothetical protein